MVGMPRAITKCPSCGSPVTNYALGCAVCGADIAAAREAVAHRRSTRLMDRAALPGFSLGEDGLRLAIALIVALIAPLFGLALAAWFAWQMHNEGSHTARNLMIAVAVIAALPLLTGYSVWGGRFLLGY